MISNGEIKRLGADLRYAVGPMLYCPADNNISSNLLTGKLGHVNTLIMCLEDSILPQNVGTAEIILRNTFSQLDAVENKEDLPLIFVRVRNPQHLLHVHELIGRYDFLTGYVFPKFDWSNMQEYANAVHSLGVGTRKLYYMPILESWRIMGADRRSELHRIREFLSNKVMDENILNILVGSNDMCVKYGVRRNVTQTVYDIGVVRDVLVDIVQAFSDRYVINGPVWEYFDGPLWSDGLKRETALDKINGFIGKACIHPRQVAVVQEEMKVDRLDWEDAEDLLNWDTDKGVQRSRNSGRMNEIATNLQWAKRVHALGKIYGVKES